MATVAEVRRIVHRWELERFREATDELELGRQETERSFELFGRDKDDDDKT